MTDAEWIELFELELRRRGSSEERARTDAERIVSNPDPETLRKLNLPENVVRRFLRGGSANARL